MWTAGDLSPWVVIVLQRQQEGIDSLIANAHTIVESCPSRRKIFAHLAYSHMHDGVNLKFRKISLKRRLRLQRGAVRHEILVQRGMLATSTLEFDGDMDYRRPAINSDPWICMPKMVQGTSAAAVEPAVVAAQPSFLTMWDVQALKVATREVDSVSAIKVADKGSGNILMYKQLAAHYRKNVMRQVPKALLFIDTCGMHLHHRAKLDIKPLRRHTLRQFGISKLYKHQDIQVKMQTYIDFVVPKRLRRIVAPPPPNQKSCGDA